MNEFRPQGGTGRAAGRAHEASDLNLAAAAVFGGALLAAAVVIHFLLAGLLGRFGARARAQDAPPRPVKAEARPPAAPPLQTTPAADLQRLREAEAAELGSYGWTDRAAGRVRVPVDRAVDLLLERGLPAREAGR